MISRTGDNFFAAHYDWIAAGVGALALAGAVAYCFLGGDVEDEIADFWVYLIEIFIIETSEGLDCWLIFGETG